MDNLKVRKQIRLKEAALEDAHIVYEVLKACGFDLLQNQGSDHWWPPYPLKKVIEDIQNKDKKVYLITYNDIIVGTFMILSSYPSYYNPSIWGDIKNSIYLAKMAVLPEFRKLGIAKWCLNEIDKLAIERQVDYVRLDVYENSKYVIDLYKAYGYIYKGIVQTPRFRVVCMEKRIN